MLPPRVPVTLVAEAGKAAVERMDTIANKRAPAFLKISSFSSFVHPVKPEQTLLSEKIL